jgi:hypothetical protein
VILFFSCFENSLFSYYSILIRQVIRVSFNFNTSRYYARFTYCSKLISNMYLKSA